VVNEGGGLVLAILKIIVGNHMMRIIGSIIFLIIAFASQVDAVRLKEIASFKGVRSNPLIGYGLVVGLNGTGDGSNADFTIRSIINMLERMGIHIDRERINQIKPKNVAAVMVTANLPPFSKIGSKIDVLISSIGDAKSLQGGTLLLTPLLGVDRQIYALAQGPILVGGFVASGTTGTSAQKNHPTVGTIPKGAIVEREVPVSVNEKKELVLNLLNPDFTTAEKIKDLINKNSGEEVARCMDSGSLKIKVPDPYQNRVTEWIALIERLEVTPDSVAKVVINERTGTVVMGEHVRISTVAIAHGGLSIQVKERFLVSQPPPFSPNAGKGGPSVIPPGEGTIVTPGGNTVVTPESNVSAKEEEGALFLVQGVNLGELIKALNAIGVTPRDLISILQAIKAAGALQADLEII
jgi:flagellar P-ring protein precursor FlgI